MKSILVAGGNGQVGRALAEAPCPEGYAVVVLGRTGLDLADPDAIARVVAAGHDGSAWAAVINAGAYTAVDKAEGEAVAAWRVKALAPAALGAACRAADIPLVQVSTDYVFAGDKAEAWEVDDPTGPLGVYGASKLGGELAVRTSGASHAIVRTACVVSAGDGNFVSTMLRLAASRDALRVVAITVQLVEGAPSSTLHFSNAGATDWATFATEIFRQSALRGGPTAQVERIATADDPTPACRPASSLLAHASLVAWCIVPRPWQQALSDMLDTKIGPAT